MSATARKLPALFFALLALALALAAPAPAQNQPEGHTFRAIYPKAPLSLDPHQSPPDPAAWPIIMACYNRLLTLSPGGADISPALAKTMRVSDDGLMYTFILNEGLTFSDGRPVDSEAALFTFDRLMSSEVGRLYYPHLYRLEIIGPYTFRLILRQPWPPFAASLTMPQASFISPGLAGQPAKYLEDHSLGSGRYVVADWRDETIGLKIRDDLVSRPDISFAMYHFEPDAQKRYEKALKHSVHLAIDPARPGPALPEPYLAKSAATFGVRYLAFNTRRPYLKMKGTRQALRLIVTEAFKDRPALRGPFPAGLYAGVPPQELPLLAGLETRSPLEQAQAVLQKIGPPPGPLTLALKSRDLAGDAQVIAAALKPHGLALNLVALDGAAGAKIMNEGDYDFFLDTRRPDLPSPEMWLGRFLDSRASANGNPALFRNAEADRLIDDITNTLSGRERETRLRDLAGVWQEESPYAFLYQLTASLVTDRRLEKLEPHPMWPEVWPLDQTSLKGLNYRSGVNPQGRPPVRPEPPAAEAPAEPPPPPEPEPPVSPIPPPPRF